MTGNKKIANFGENGIVPHIQLLFFPEKKQSYLFRKAMKYLATIVYEKAPALRIILHPLMVAKQQTTVP